MLTVQRKPLPLRYAQSVYYFFHNLIVKGYGRLFKPEIPGTKMFVSYQDKLLLVRLGYAHKKWVLPGGKIDNAENSITAAVREAHEEAGVDLISCRFLCERRYETKDRKIDMYYYQGQAKNEDLIIDGQEIIDAKWFSLDNLPDDCSPRLAQEIPLYEKYRH